MVKVGGTPTPPPNVTAKTWGIPNPAVSTRTVNVSAIEAVEEREKYCPDFSDTTIEVIEDLPEDCFELWDAYCHPLPDDPILPSPTSVASSCKPAYYAFTAEGENVSLEAITTSQQRTTSTSSDADRSTNFTNNTSEASSTRSTGSVSASRDSTASQATSVSS